jgi:long-chain fatty acid transport protein
MRRRPDRLRKAAIFALAVCLLSPASAVFAQTNERLYENLSFRFTTPGARAAAMGKTFIGLADDATAAVSNPAGLSNLLEQEFSFEFSGTELRHQRTGELGVGDVETFGSFVFTPTFFSYVLPIHRGTVSFFRNSVQNFSEKFQFGPREVATRGQPEDGAFGQILVNAESYGVGGAFVVNRWLSVGGSVGVMSLDFASESRSGTPLNQRNGTNTIYSGVKWSGAAGVLMKPTRRVAVGANFIQGATFTMKTRLFGRFLWTVLDPEGTIVLSGEERPIDYVIPDRFSVGGSWRVTDGLTVLADLARVLYSQRITSNFLVVDFIDPAAGLSPANFSIRNVTELHAGTEYRLYNKPLTMAFRAGVFTDPDHPLRFVRGGNNPDHPADKLLDFRFNTLVAKTNVGVTAGWGILVKNRVQVDLAATHSPEATEVIASIVLRVR